MIRKVIVSILLAAIVLAFGGGVTAWLIKSRAKPAQEITVARAPLVDVVTLAPEDVREILHGYGSARADRQATLAAEVSAAVVELVGGLQEGVAVSEGQLLVRLDDREYVQQLHEAQAAVQAKQAELDQHQVERSNLSSLLEIATADLKLNRDDLDRVSKLFEQGNAPKKEFDDTRLRYQASLRAKQMLDNQFALLQPNLLRLQSEHTAAEARVERAELNIERCRIVAPFDGSVASLAIDVGDKVRVGSEILKLVNLDRIEIPVQLPVSKRPRTDAGASVALRVESMPDTVWNGSVARIAPLADERSRTFEVYVEVDNRDQATPLLPGYFVKAEVDGPIIAGALVVPRQSLIGDHIFVINGGQAHERGIHVVRHLGDQAAIAGDIAPGDRVITTNLDMLFDGASVRVDDAVADNGETHAAETPAPAEAVETEEVASGSEGAS